MYKSAAVKSTQESRHLLRTLKFPIVRTGISYSMLNSQSFDEAIDVLATAFWNGDPFTRGFGIKPDEIKQGLTRMKKELVENEMCIVCRDKFL